MLKLSKKLRSRQHEFKLSKKSQATLIAAGVERVWYSCGYAHVKFRGRNHHLHRVLMVLIGHKVSGLEVDHKNRRKLDNRLYNLRLVTSNQNRFNRDSQKNNSSGFKGVHLNKKLKKFVAYIGKRPRIHLGTFECPVAAARAYDAAAKKRYGKFAKLNAC